MTTYTIRTLTTAGEIELTHATATSTAPAAAAQFDAEIRQAVNAVAARWMLARVMTPNGLKIAEVFHRC